MSKKDEFKKFISNHTELIDYVKNNKVSWQSLYELYDLYGEKEDIWKKYTSSSINDGLSIKSLLNTLKMINLDSLEENISSIQKAVNLVEELTKPNNEEEIKPKENKIDKLYGEDNES